ncbi:MAG: oxidoreductase [Acidiphilium sp. 34-60-192]|nr:MAG: oxidoreductase [Acidiphilium sp. 34-60-192]
MDDHFRTKTALITGASSGIGAAMARDLAQRGANLVLVARRADRLEALAAECRLFGVTAMVAPADLADGQARADLVQRFATVDVLINNAGLTALTDLTRLFAPLMAARGYGRIMLVASTAAFQPVPLYAAYAASKSYVLSLGEALDVELAPQGVRVSVLCPGVTETEFFAVADQTRSDFTKKSAMTASEVARIGLDALANGRSSVVAGTMNAAMAFGTRFAPRALAAKIAFRTIKP